MALSSQTLRKVFKNNIDSLINKATIERRPETLVSEIQRISEDLEKLIYEKIQLLEIDFHDHQLSGDYLRTVSEGFDDLERLLRSNKTFADKAQVKTTSVDDLLHHIKTHYNDTLVPLLNIMAKLENDYISIATNCIQKKQECLNQIQSNLQKLKVEEGNTKRSILILNKKNRLDEINQSMKILNLKRKVVQLSLHHDRLNLYYFNHDHPIELREIKQKVDILRIELRKLKEESGDEQKNVEKE